MIGLDDNDVLNVAAQLRQAIDELKGRQIVGGASTVVRHNTSSDLYDRSASISGFSQRFTIDFTADRQANALADLSIDVFRDNPTMPATFYDDYYLNIFLQANDPAMPYLSRWIVDLYKTISGTHTFYLKATVMSVDSGIVS